VLFFWRGYRWVWRFRGGINGGGRPVSGETVEEATHFSAREKENPGN
jgi:hypothetical protein